MSVERNPNYSLEDLWEDYPDGIGDNPGQAAPVSQTIEVRGLKTEGAFKKVMQGRLRPIVEAYHKRGFHVGAKWTRDQVTLFASEHRNLIGPEKRIKIIAATSIGIVGAAGVASAFYMTRRSSKRKINRE